MVNEMTEAYDTGFRFLYNENPAIVAGFYVGYADEQKANKKSA